jgi:hypothetical protein
VANPKVRKGMPSVAISKAEQLTQPDARLREVLAK